MHWALAGAATGLAGMAATARAQSGRQGQHTKGGHSGMMEECLDQCTECTEVCNRTAHHCFEKAGDGDSKHLKALHYTIDCQEFCAQAAKLIARESPLMAAACHGCAEACEACAEVCERASDDEQMSDCAKTCRECARSCREMVEAMGHGRQSAGRGRRPR